MEHMVAKDDLRRNHADKQVGSDKANTQSSSQNHMGDNQADLLKPINLVSRTMIPKQNGSSLLVFLSCPASRSNNRSVDAALLRDLSHPDQ